MTRVTVLLCIICLVVTACDNRTNNLSRIELSTSSDSARYYFDKGWAEIMDYGKWTAAEASFRRAVSLDSSFVLGWSLVGRITSDPVERDSILGYLERSVQRLPADEVRLAEVYSNNIRLMNLRDHGADSIPLLRREARKQAETTFRRVVHRYPGEGYVLSEYIEVLHSLYGPAAALDSLHYFTANRENEIPFLKYYEATLLSELGRFQTALAAAEVYKELVGARGKPAELTLSAQIYCDMDSLERAMQCISEAVELDSNHLVAQALRDEIGSLLNARDIE